MCPKNFQKTQKKIFCNAKGTAGPVHLSVCLSVGLLVCLSVCLFLFQSLYFMAVYKPKEYVPQVLKPMAKRS